MKNLYHGALSYHQKTALQMCLDRVGGYCKYSLAKEDAISRATFRGGVEIPAPIQSETISVHYVVDSGKVVAADTCCQLGGDFTYPDEVVKSFNVKVWSVKNA